MNNNGKSYFWLNPALLTKHCAICRSFGNFDKTEKNIKIITNLPFLSPCLYSVMASMAD